MPALSGVDVTTERCDVCLRLALVATWRLPIAGTVVPRARLCLSCCALAQQKIGYAAMQRVSST